MKKVLIGIMILISGCKVDINNWSISYPQEIEEEVNLFLDYAPDRVPRRPVEIILQDSVFNNQGEVVWGISDPKNKQIRLSTSSYLWKNSRKLLVLHELGHYVLEREHLEGKITEPGLWEYSEFYPISLMNPEGFIPDDEDMENPIILDYYITELFSDR